MHLFFGFLIALITASWVGWDAHRRGMNSVGWAIGTFLLLIVFLPLYLIVRKPVLGIPVLYPPPDTTRPCHACGKTHLGDARYCPWCGAPQP